MHQHPHIARTIGLAVFATAMTFCPVQAQGYSNFIRQQQQGTNVTWDMPVAPTGAAPAALLAQEGGSLFQLWTISQSTAKDYLLDQKLVGAYLPKGSVVIRTQDSFAGIPRIRVDQPFSVDFTVSNLVFGANVPASASKVLVEHHLVSNPTTQFTPAQATSGTPYSSGYIGTNGPTTVSYAASSIRFTDPLKARGEEHFVMHVLPDGNFLQTQIASAYLKVFPMATGTISGIAKGAMLRGTPPALTVKLDDLYPTSSTSLRIYSDGPKLGNDGMMITGSDFTIDQDKSMNKTYTVTDYAHYFDSDGSYRIDLISITPFGAEVLDSIPFTVDRSLRINTMMVDGEITSN